MYADALLILPLAALPAFNDPAGWKAAYGNLDNITFFASDLFGGLFGVQDGIIRRFDPETGDLEDFAESMDDWAAKLQADTDYETGQSLALAWRDRHGDIPPGYRLIPKIPFVLGGQYDLDNLYPAELQHSLRARAEIAAQIRDLPDGSRIEIRPV